MKVCIGAGTAELTKMQMNLLSVGYGEFAAVVRLTVFLDEPQLALGSIGREFDPKLDRELQRLRRIKVGLLVDAAEFHIVDDDGLVIRMQEGTLGIRQGTKAEEARHRQDTDE
jgi:hypothetical protein